MQSNQTKTAQAVVPPVQQPSGPQPLDAKEFARVVGGLPKGGWGIEPESENGASAA